MADKDKGEREVKSDWISDLFGMDRHAEKPNEYGGSHHTVSNDVTRISWDDDKSGNYVKSDSKGRESHHETLAPNRRAGKSKP